MTDGQAWIRRFTRRGLMGGTVITEAELMRYTDAARLSDQVLLGCTR